MAPELLLLLLMLWVWNRSEALMAAVELVDTISPPPPTFWNSIKLSIILHSKQFTYLLSIHYSHKHFWVITVLFFTWNFFVFSFTCTMISSYHGKIQNEVISNVLFTPTIVTCFYFLSFWTVHCSSKGLNEEKKYYYCYTTFQYLTLLSLLGLLVLKLSAP